MNEIPIGSRGTFELVVGPDHLANRLRHPASRLRERSRALASLAARLSLAWRAQTARRTMKLAPLTARWVGRRQFVLAQSKSLRHAAHALARIASGRMHMLAARVAKCESALAHLDPDAVLARGYSMVLRDDGSIVASSQQIALVERVRMRFAQGSAHARVEDKDNVT